KRAQMTSPALREEEDDAFVIASLDTHHLARPDAARPAATRLWLWLWLGAAALGVPYWAALAATAWAPLLALWVLPAALAAGLLAGGAAVGLDRLLARHFPLVPALGLGACGLGLALAAGCGALLTTLPGGLATPADALAASDPSVARGLLALGAAAGALP